MTEQEQEVWILTETHRGCTDIVGVFQNEILANTEAVKCEDMPAVERWVVRNCVSPSVCQEPAEKTEAKCKKCGKIFYCAEDYDTLGSESGVCCPVCGNEDFEPVETEKLISFVKTTEVIAENMQLRDSLEAANKEIAQLEELDRQHEVELAELRRDLIDARKGE